MRLHSVELRQYAMKPGRRDALIALFEREFVETQEAAGIRLIGLFRDLDDPDRFVWLRGYPTPEARRPALEAFYDSEHWLTHRAAANATMISSDDVLLLQPLSSDGGLDASAPVPDGSAPGRGVVVLGVHRLTGLDDRLAEAFAHGLSQALDEAGLPVEAALITDPAPNAFPRHPVREGERVLVWFSRQPEPAVADAALARARAEPTLAPLFGSALQVLRLSPTARSRLQG
jgi:quinol monooxygenase YgiN